MDCGFAIFVVAAVLLLVVAPIWSFVSARRALTAAALARDEVLKLRQKIARLEAVAGVGGPVPEVRPAADAAPAEVDDVARSHDVADDVGVAPPPLPSDSAIEKDARAAEALAGDREPKDSVETERMPPSPPTAPPVPMRRISADATPAEGRGVELALGGRIYVWLGGLALALAGAFFVKFAIDHALIGPAARCWIGFAFGLGLIGAGEHQRRVAPMIGQALTGAGVAVQYAVLFVAGEVYGFVGPGLGLALLAALTAGAVVLSLRHGPFVAVLGMLGGFGMPALLHADDSNGIPRLAYLAALHAGIQFIARRTARRAFALMSLVASLVWAVATLDGGFVATPLDALAPFVLIIAAVSVLGAFQTSDKPQDAFDDGLPTVLAVLAGSAILALVVARAGFPPYAWWYMAAASAGGLALARLRPAVRFAGWLPAAASVAVYAVYASSHIGDVSTIVAIGGILIFGAGSALVAAGASKPAVFAWLSAVGTAAFASAAWRFDAPLPSWCPWWALALVLGGGHALAARAHLLRRSDPLRREAAVPHVYAAAAAVAAAAALAFDDEPVAVSLVSLAPLGLLLARRLDLRELRSCSAVSAVIGCLLVLFRDNPAARMIRDLEPHWDALWFSTGVPVLALVVAAWLLRNDDEHHPKRRYALAAARLAILGVGLTARYLAWEKPTDLLAFTVRDAGVLASAWFALAVVLALLAHRLPALVHKLAGIGAAVFALVAVIAPHRSPIWALTAAGAVGATPFWNSLLLLYLLPAVGCFALARIWSRLEGVPAESWGSAGVFGVTGAFVWITAAVRHAMANGDPSSAPTNAAEVGVMMIAWLGFVLVVAELRARRLSSIPKDAETALLIVSLAAFALFHETRGVPFRFWEIRPEWIGNELLLLYAAPAALLYVIAWRLRLAGKTVVSAVAGIGGVLMGWIWISTVLRNGFRIGLPPEGAMAESELYAYSAAWIVYAVVLLAAGVKSGSFALRMASAVVMGVAVCKVFLFDAAGLRDLWRVASFLGLGLTLIVLGRVYQRFVFAAPRPSPAVPPAAALLPDVPPTAAPSVLPTSAPPTSPPT